MSTSVIHPAANTLDLGNANERLEFDVRPYSTVAIQAIEDNPSTAWATAVVDVKRAISGAGPAVALSPALEITAPGITQPIDVRTISTLVLEVSTSQSGARGKFVLGAESSLPTLTGASAR